MDNFEQENLNQGDFFEEPTNQVTQPEWESDVEYDANESEKQLNVLALLSMIFGIVGMVLTVVCCNRIAVISIPLLVAALVMGIIANKKEKTGMGTAGFILGLVGIIISLILLTISIVLMLLGLGSNLLMMMLTGLFSIPVSEQYY